MWIGKLHKAHACGACESAVGGAWEGMDDPEDVMCHAMSQAQEAPHRTSARPGAGGGELRPGRDCQQSHFCHQLRL